MNNLSPIANRFVEGEDEIVALVTEAKEEVVDETPVDVTAIGLSVEKGKKEEDTEAAA